MRFSMTGSGWLQRDFETFAASSSAAGLSWLGYNLYAIGGAVASFKVQTDGTNPPQVQGLGPRFDLPFDYEVVYLPEADFLNGRPVFSFLTLGRDGTYRSLQLLGATVAPPSQDGAGFAFGQPVTLAPDLTLATSLLAPGTTLWINAFASAVGPRIPVPGEAPQQGDALYYFVAVQGLPGLYYFTSDGFTASALRPLPEPVGSALAAYTFVNLDATPVHLGGNGAGIALGGTAVDANGNTAPLVAVFSLSGATPEPACWQLYPGLGAALQPPNRYPPLSIPDPTQVLLSLCWGPSETDAGMKAGSILTVFAWAPPQQVLYMQLDLLDPAASDPTFSWGTILSDDVNPMVAGAFPVSFEAEGLPPMGNGRSIDGGEFICFFYYGTFPFAQHYEVYNVFLPSLLFSSSGTPRNYQSVVDGSMPPEVAAAHVASWSLIGVVTGLPPYDPATFAPDGGQVGVTFESSREQTNGNQTTSQSTILIGGSAEGVDAQADWTWGSKSSTKSSWKLSFGEAIQPPDSGASWWNRAGYLVVVTPVYQRAQYDVFNWDQAACGLSMQVLSTIGGDPQIYTFDLTNPNQGPVQGEDGPADGPAALYSFPVGDDGVAIARWPTLDQLESWSVDPSGDPRLGSVVPLLPGLLLNAISASTANAFTESLDLAGQQSQSTESENSIDLSAGFELFGIGIKSGFTVRRGEEIETDFGHSVTISFSYPQLKSGQPRRRVEIQPYLLRANADGLPWVPTLLAGQRPWILTWQFIPQGE